MQSFTHLKSGTQNMEQQLYWFNDKKTWNIHNEARFIDSLWSIKKVKLSRIIFMLRYHCKCDIIARLTYIIGIEEGEELKEGWVQSNSINEINIANKIVGWVGIVYSVILVPPHIIKCNDKGY
jgi:hypothetical protein